MGVEDVDDLGEICERPRQAIDLAFKMSAVPFHMWTHGPPREAPHASEARCAEGTCRRHGVAGRLGAAA
jgi:hypothetical protein